jgi:hypothetical protein
MLTPRLNLIINSAKRFLDMAMILAGLRVWIKVIVGVGRLFIGLLHGRLHLADAPFADFGTTIGLAL